MQDLLNQKARGLSPRHIASDIQLYLVLLGTLITGIGLNQWLPAGYAQDILSRPWPLLYMLLLSPLLEEWLFRGLLQGELLQRGWGGRKITGISVANLMTSVAFVLAHAVYHPWLWALAVVVPSLVLGHFRERYGRLSPPILLHFLFNLTYLLAGLSWGWPG